MKTIWINNDFSAAYEKDIRRATRFIPVYLFILMVFSTVIFFHTLEGILIGLTITFSILMLAVFALRSGDDNIPEKIGISDKGVYYKGSYFRENPKNKGFIPWEKVHRIGPMDSTHPDDYLLLYRGRDDRILKAYNWFGYTELALGFEAAQEVMKRYEEYEKRGDEK